MLAGPALQRQICRLHSLGESDAWTSVYHCLSGVVCFAHVAVCLCIPAQEGVLGKL